MLNSNLLKHLVYKEIRSAYWSYTNNLIAPEEHPDSNQKRFWSYIKALRRENTNIPVLKITMALVMKVAWIRLRC